LGDHLGWWLVYRYVEKDRAGARRAIAAARRSGSGGEEMDIRIGSIIERHVREAM
jgi:hypothetical protein